MKVKFCEKNKWTNDVISKITETHPSIRVSTKKCLGKCHKCKAHPIAKVDKKILVGTDEENLYNKIITALLD